MCDIKLSVVTVALNDLKGLRQTIMCMDNLLMGRTESNVVEHVIIDGDSSDGTKEFLNDLVSYRSIKTIIISERDRGVYDAMNKGIFLSSGAFITFINAGDLFASSLNFLDIFDDLDASQNNTKEAGIVYSARINFNKKEYTANPRMVTRNNPRLPGIHQAMVYKRAIIVNNIFNINYKICGDYENFARIFNLKLVFRPIKRDFVIFYSGGISSNNPFKLFKESISITNKYFHLNLIDRVVLTLRLIIKLIIFQVIILLYK
jgi:putative colanic acid biosynthesis glycosyltransferase